MYIIQQNIMKRRLQKEEENWFSGFKRRNKKQGISMKTGRGASGNFGPYD